MPNVSPPRHDDGLVEDLSTLWSRRRALGLGFTASAAAVLTACAPASERAASSSSPSTPTAASSSATASTSASASSSASTSALADCGVEIPQETAGPYPADGTNGPDVLEQSGIVRRDITTSFGTASGSVDGVQLTVQLTLLDISSGQCLPLRGAAVYLWHCDPQGNYSLYSSGFEEENWLRGVQAADANGRVEFTTVFPGAYPGRYPHIHFEVFRALDQIDDAGRVIAVSQLALPADACAEVYAQSGYGSSAGNLERTPLTRDNVFGDDGGIHQLGTVSGSVDQGYTVGLNVSVA